MLQDTAAIEYKHKKFVERVVDFDTVWALESDEGFATSDSNDFEDTNVIPFWSDRAYATSLIKDDWRNYKPVSMPLGEFIENWLVGMYGDGFIVGTNWDANMFGKEIDPLELALEITDHLTAKGKSLRLGKYKDIIDFQTQVRKVLE